jgi:hypothetical protein
LRFSIPARDDQKIANGPEGSPPTLVGPEYTNARETVILNSFHSKKAVMLADPASLPMVKPTLTGFAVPARFAFVARAAKMYLPLLIGWITITMSSFTPLIVPENRVPARVSRSDIFLRTGEPVPSALCDHDIAEQEKRACSFRADPETQTLPRLTLAVVLTQVPFVVINVALVFVAVLAVIPHITPVVIDEDSAALQEPGRNFPGGGLIDAEFVGLRWAAGDLRAALLCDRH